MDNQKDRFGETIRLVEKAKEDIFFAARDRELVENYGRRPARSIELKPSAASNVRASWRVIAFMASLSIAAKNAVAFGWTKVS